MAAPLHCSPDDLPATPDTRFHRLLRQALAALTGVLLGVWIAATPPGLLGKADAIGYAICHRIPERSLHVHDRPMPMCARCTGIYLGATAGLIVLARRGRLRAGRWPRLRLIAALMGAGALYGIDGLNSYLTMFPGYTPLYTPHNTLRLLTGASFGLAMITLLLPGFNALAWRDPLPAAPIDDWRDLARLYVAAGAAAALVLTRQPAILIAAGLVTAAAVMGVFILLGSVAMLAITRRENQAQDWSDLVFPMLGGLAFALVILGGIDLVRYLLTGTWDGFSLN